jgi:hypothetical protein
MNYIDLSQLSTPQLRAIKNVLEHGSLACGTFFPDKKTLKKLQAENENLKKLNERRDAVEAAGIDWDSDYWMSFKTEAEFSYFLNLFVQTREKAEKEAVAESKPLRVPQLFGQIDLNPTEMVREGLRARRNGDGE